MKATRAYFLPTTTLVIFTWLVFSGTTFIGSAQTPSTGLTVETFYNALHGNDTNTVSKMLEANTNLVHAFYYGRLPITVAAGDGSLQMVELLLKQGADVNVKNDTWNTSNMRLTALDAAIWTGNTNLCKLLLEAGANPDLQSTMGESALHYAFGYHRAEMAAWLLDYGSDPFLPKFTYGQVTPFELAITQGDGKLVPRMLGQEGAGPAGLKPTHPLPWKKTPAENRQAAAKIIAERGTELLSAAAQRGELEAVEALLKAGVSARTNAPGELPLMQAFAISEAASVKSRTSVIAQWQQTSNTLKSFGPNANPEFTASIRSQEAEQAAKVVAFAPEHLMRIRDLLIKHGADYDAFAATALADTNRAIQLLAADRNVAQARDRDGQTPLHWAVLNDQLPLTSFWLKAGASPAATNFAGQTPLHIAATKGLTEQVKLLLAANAPTDIRDTNGWTPLDAAIQAKQSDCIHLLMAKSPAAAHPERGLATPLHEAAASGNVAALAGLLDTETNLEARNELGLTPLQVAVLHGHLSAAALLVDKGAEVNVRDPAGNTLLHQILLQDQLIIYDRPPTNWLARVGQDPSKQLYLKYLTVGQNEQGPNPLLQAASFLLASGADATAINKAGQTAMQLITGEKLGRGVFFFDNDRTELLQLLGAHGGNVNERDANGNTALHRLVAGFYDMSKSEQIASLIASGADVNATNNLGQTPLHLAAEKIDMWDENNPPIYSPFQYLIYLKADVNAQDNQGLTPLDALALSDSSFRKEATRALLDAGAKPNLRDKQGRTPAHLFLYGKFPWQDAGECIDMLAAAGADLSAKDDKGKTPLHYLAALGSQSPMFFLRGIGDTFVLAKVDFNARDNDGDTPLHIAARTGTRDVYDWLVKQGASLDATNHASETPRQLAMHSTDSFSRFRPNADTDINQAIREGKLESVAAILKSEPGLLNRTNQFGQTPLLVAAQTRRTNIVDFLDAQGVRWDPVSAIVMGRTEILRKLIAQQPQLAFSGSLLYVAAANGNVPATEILLAAGSDLKATDPFGRSPLGIAVWQQHGDVAELLTKQGATKNIIDAAFTDDAETAAALIDRDKSSASATNAVGVSVAEIAAAMGNTKVLKLLLDKGVSPNFQNPLNGKSLLDTTAEFNQTNTAELLIQRRAKLDVADKLGFSPIHTAALQGSAAVLELFLKHKADCKLRTKAQDLPHPSAGGRPPFANWPLIASQEDTPLHLAALAGQTNSIALLLKWGAPVNATNADGMTPLDLASQIGQQPFLWMGTIDRRFPITPSANLMVNPSLRRNATMALLQQAGGKHGESRGPAGMMPFGPPTMARFPPMTGAPGPQAPVLQTGADYHTQGCLDYNARRFTNALADFRKSCELGSDNQDYSYFRIWLIRSRLGEKEAATQELKAYLEHRTVHQPEDWPLKVGRFLTGRLSESDFLKAADDTDPQIAKEQHCEAYFYVGSKHLIENDKMAAVDYFKKCLTTNLTNFEEYRSSAMELLFLQMPSINPK
jgi:ankyrin repeat protein